MKTAKPETKKTNINLNKLKIKAAKTLAYISLVVAASYGFRQALSSLDDIAQMTLTVLSVLALVFIISLNED